MTSLLDSKQRGSSFSRSSSIATLWRRNGEDPFVIILTDGYSSTIVLGFGLKSDLLSLTGIAFGEGAGLASPPTGRRARGLLRKGGAVEKKC